VKLALVATLSLRGLCGLVNSERLYHSAAEPQPNLYIPYTGEHCHRGQHFCAACNEFQD